MARSSSASCSRASSSRNVSSEAWHDFSLAPRCSKNGRTRRIVDMSKLVFREMREIRRRDHVAAAEAAVADFEAVDRKVSVDRSILGLLLGSAHYGFFTRASRASFSAPLLSVSVLCLCLCLCLTVLPSARCPLPTPLLQHRPICYPSFNSRACCCRSRSRARNPAQMLVLSAPT